MFKKKVIHLVKIIFNLTQINYNIWYYPKLKYNIQLNHYTNNPKQYTKYYNKNPHSKLII